MYADYRLASAAWQEFDSSGAGSFSARGSRYCVGLHGPHNAVESARTSSLGVTRRTTTIVLRLHVLRSVLRCVRRPASRPIRRRPRCPSSCRLSASLLSGRTRPQRRANKHGEPCHSGEAPRLSCLRPASVATRTSPSFACTTPRRTSQLSRSQGARQMMAPAPPKV